MRGVRLKERGPLPPELCGRWVVLWDGECGLCRRSVAAVLRRTRAGEVTAAPYQGCTAWLPEPVHLRSAAQAHLRSPQGEYWGGGAAFTRLLGLMGHPRLERLLESPLLRPLVGWGYRWVARNRGWLGRLPLFRRG